MNLTLLKKVELKDKKKRRFYQNLKFIENFYSFKKY